MDTHAQGCKDTRRVLVWTQLSSELMISLYAMIAFILRKDFDAPLWIVSCFLILRPASALFSIYWSHFKFTYIKHHLMWGTIFSYLPFLCIPFFPTTTFLFFAAASYQLFSRGSIPSLIELVKQNIPEDPRKKYFSFTFLIGFITSGVFAYAIGYILDRNILSSEQFLSLAAAIGLTALFSHISLPQQHMPKHTEAVKDHFFITPWKEAYTLFTQDKHLAIFQTVFFLGGGALMMAAPALAMYYSDILHLSYTELSLARFLFMGIGISVTTQFWRRFLHKKSLFSAMGFVLIGFFLFIVSIFLARFSIEFLYGAFFLYGIAQAGSHAIWHLSPTFFTEGDTTPFSRMNVCLLGIRGVIFPFLGAFCSDRFGIDAVLIITALLTTFGAILSLSGYTKIEEVLSR